jgi:hypothetical protein
MDRAAERRSSRVTLALDFFYPAVSNRETTASVLIYTEGGMNLLDALRHAEQQGKNQVRRGAEKLHNVETAIRRKVHPDPTLGKCAAPAEASSPDSLHWPVGKRHSIHNSLRI